MINVAIIGKPNVGKSTVFNSICGRRLSIVEDVAGVTRDTKDFILKLGSSVIRMIDTPGWINDIHTSLDDAVRNKLLEVYDLSDILIFVVDGKHGLTSLDVEYAHLVRMLSKRSILAVNKAEGKLDNINDVYSLGLSDDPILISAIHGIGISELVERISSIASEIDKGESDAEAFEDLSGKCDVRVSLFGRPNVGKSTIFNKLVGEDRAIVSEYSGTTRDPVEYIIHDADMRVKLIDTAGLRVKSRVSGSVEKLSTKASLASMRSSDIGVIIMDATQALERQDLTISSLMLEQGLSILIVFNKCDMIPNEKRKSYRKDALEFISSYVSQMRNAKVEFISALHDRFKEKLIKSFIAIAGERTIKVSTGKLNRIFNKLLEERSPPVLKKNHRPKLKYIVQTGVNPPKFNIFGNFTETIPDTYTRYLINGFKKALGITATPIVIQYTKNKNKFI